MTSRRPYWCPRAMKRRPCWCPKTIPWELNSFLMQTLPFVPINLHRCWPHEWKYSIEPFHTRAQQLCKFSRNKRKDRICNTNIPPTVSLSCDTTDVWRTWRPVKTLFWAFSRDVTVAIMVSQNSPVGVELFSYVNDFFCSINLHRCWPREWKRSIVAAFCLWTTGSRGSVVRIRWRKTLLYPSSFSRRFFVSFRSQWWLQQT